MHRYDMCLDGNVTAPGSIETGLLQPFTWSMEFERDYFDRSGGTQHYEGDGKGAWTGQSPPAKVTVRTDSYGPTAYFNDNAESTLAVLRTFNDLRRIRTHPRDHHGLRRQP